MQLHDVYNWFTLLAPALIRPVFSNSWNSLAITPLILCLNPEFEFSIGESYDALELDTDLLSTEVIISPIEYFAGKPEDFEGENIKVFDDPWDMDLPTVARPVVSFDLGVFSVWLHADGPKYGFLPTLMEEETRRVEKLPKEYMFRLNLMHVIRSYLNRWIWSGVRKFLFYDVYYYFPLIYYVPSYIRDYFFEKYFWMKIFFYLSEITNKRFQLTQIPTPSDLQIWDDFLITFQFDKKIPWLDFKEIFIFTLKPFWFSLNNVFVKRLNFWANFLLKKKNLRSFHDPLDHFILKSFLSREIITLSGLFTILVFESISSEFFFSKSTRHKLVSLLDKPQKYTIASFSNTILLNDRQFFWPIFKEFDIKFGPAKLRKPRGWPKKKKLFYFIWEEEFFPQKIDLNLISSDMYKIVPLFNKKKFNFFFMTIFFSRFFFYFKKAF